MAGSGPKASSGVTTHDGSKQQLTKAVAQARELRKGTSSLPSHEAYVVDVPEVTDLAARFQYNYFVPDEGSNETGAVPARFLARSGEMFDAETIDTMTSRTPRYVMLTFTPPRPTGSSRSLTEQQQKETGDKVGQAGTLIADNIDKIVPEDRFASQRFVSIAFQDAELADSLYEFVSGTYVQHTLEAAGDADASHRRAASRLTTALKGAVPAHFIEQSIVRPDLAHGTRFFGRRTTSQIRRPAVNVSMQLNAKLYHDVIARGLNDPNDHFAGDMHALYHSSRRIQREARMRFNPSVTEGDYRSYVPYTSIKFTSAAYMPVPNPASIVGYVVDRVETLPDGSRRVREPIVIENPVVGRTVDLRMRYGAAYTYSVRTVARFTLPVIDDETGQIALATVLVSSRPSNRVVLRCTEDEAPPPPADVGFSWDHDAERMAVHWTFPPNPQRDVKRFHVFRRASVNEPYELLRAYDFDDSTVPIKQRERVPEHLIERMTSPRSRYVDEDFTRTSRFIYALGCVDAHGNVSAYSAQHEVSFDQFKNRLVTRLVSHLGAPRQYPNMYLEADTFVDVIKDVGRNRLRVYFTPECYYLFDDEERVTPVVTTTREGGSYRLQFINPDAQKMGVVELTIDDKRTLTGPDVTSAFTIGA